MTKTHAIGQGKGLPVEIVKTYLLVEESSCQVLNICCEQLSATDDLAEGSKRGVDRLDQFNGIVALQHDESQDGRAASASLFTWWGHFRLDQIVALKRDRVVGICGQLKIVIKYYRHLWTVKDID